jgi:ribokinase
MDPRITVVGSVNMDLVFRTGRMPMIGETIKGHEFRQIAGGKGANQAVAAARQGARVTFIASIGDDAFGDQSLRALADEGIALAHVVRAAGTATGTAGIFVDDNGRNSIVIAGGANDVLAASDIDAAAASIASARLLICQLETPLATVARAIDIASQHDVPVILNPAPAQPLADDLLSKIGYLVLNETEASQLSGIEVVDQGSAQQAAERLLARGVGTVLLTMGEHGVCVAHAGTHTHLPALQVDAVDTTAAGDTFVGAFAVGLGRGLTVHQACAEAQFAAALTVTRLGAQTSIPKRDEVEQFMQQRRSAMT